MTNEERAELLEQYAKDLENGEQKNPEPLWFLLSLSSAFVIKSPLEDLQAAADLCARVLPEWSWKMSSSGAVWVRTSAGAQASVYSAHVPDRPAAALTAAVCRARAAELREAS